MPPTYSVPEGEPTHTARYHIETRYVEELGERRPVAVLDSVASQANRAEVALLEAFQEGKVTFPFIEVNLGDDFGGIRPGRFTSLEASHRAADAAFRECMLDGQRFRASDVGKAIFGSDQHDSTGIYKHSPLSLVFGQWDSHGGDASRGHKYARVVSSEIVGIDVAIGRHSSSRLDPLKIESATVYVNAEHAHDADAPEWTTDIDEAARDGKGNPKEYGTGKGKGKMSGLGFGNVTPSLAPEGTPEVSGKGGVTFRYAEHTTVIALNAIRQMRFPGHPSVAVEARTALAALTLAAITFRDTLGYSLRSRCWLTLEGPPTVEMVDPYGRTKAYAPIMPHEAAAILDAASAKASDAGLAWNTAPTELTPQRGLLKAVRDRKAELAEKG